MENEKEKILELINICLDNKEFYLPGKEYINGSYLGYYDDYTTDGPNFVDETDRERDYSYLKETSVFNEIIQDKKRTGTFMNYLAINFSEQPPINIGINWRNTREEIIPIELLERKFFKRKWWKLWQDKGSYLPTGYKIKKQIKKTYREYYYQVTFGSILVELTIDEGEKIYKKYLENKEKFSKEILEDKKRREFDLINERIERYGNNKHKE